MKIKCFAALAAALLAFPGQQCLAEEQGDVTTELKALVRKVQAKLEEGKRTEQELASELNEFDALLVRHKDGKPEDIAKILYTKATLYLQVFDDVVKGTEVLTRLKRDFPETEPGKAADQLLAMVKRQEEAKKIQAGLVVGSKFPDFNDNDITGKPLSLADYKGKVVLIDFWATWCRPCVAELPNVQKAYDKYHPKGFEIVGVSLDEDKAKLESFTKQQKMTWPQIFDGKAWENKLAQKYGVNSIPATYLLDGEGKIIAKDLRGSALEEAVAKALAGK
jgi:peroxiredoxin